MKIKHGLAAAALLAALSASGASRAADLWEGWGINGGASYCASTISPYPGTTYCQHTIPAGEPALTGYEMIPSDLGPLGATSSNGGPQSGLFSVLQFGTGAYSDVTSPATATIPANTPWYFIDGAQGSAFTITMPASPVDKQIQRVVCEAATVGAMTVAANTSVVAQVLKNNPAAACAVGVTYSWVYNASNLTWYRF